jgi:hypothetical protein
VIHSCDMAKPVVSVFTDGSLRLFAFNVSLIALLINLFCHSLLINHSGIRLCIMSDVGYVIKQRLNMFSS